MSGDEEPAGDKPHEPTQKKLDDARKKGEIARSADVTTAASYGGFLLTAAAFGAGALVAAGSALAGLIGNADMLAASGFTGGALMTALLRDLAGPFSLWFAGPMAAALAALLAQRALVFAPGKLAPKFNRISILKNAGQKFGRSGFFEFAKSFTKLSVYSVILGLFLMGRLPEILSSVHLAPGQVAALLARLALSFLTLVVLVAMTISVADYLWQQADHIRRNRMSRKELMDEAKQSEGDPHMKSQRRQRAQEIAMNSMLADVPDADVVIVNPTHYAVALRWTRLPGSAPECVAKGTDQIAARIRERAAEAGVPIHSDPPTARAIHATIEIGDEVQPDQYAAVAVAIRFANTMRQKAGKMVH